jgi:AcrR family transcriptional regulator
MAARTQQKERTRQAIVEAARGVLDDGAEVTMPVVAARARVSEATAYRYFPDLVSLLREAVVDTWPAADELLGAELAGLDDPAERVARAAAVLCERTLRHGVAVRAIVAASVTGAAAARPAHRFGLIDHALAPVPAGAEREQLERDLAVTVSAEALFTLIDLCGLSPDEAAASLVSTARALTRARLSQGARDGQW